ncbi:MAG: hypothetical protein PHX09_00725 [Clostridia bacterium]|nr:hypothetical protein [Clostridia bacterium]
MNKLIEKSLNKDLMENYKKLHNRLNNLLIETFYSLFCLEAITALNKKNKSGFFYHVIHLLKSNLCNNIFKLSIDTTKESKTLRNLQKQLSKIGFSLNFDLIIDKDENEILKKNIKIMRHNYISHTNISENNISIKIKDLKTILYDLYDAFKKLTIEEIIKDYKILDEQSLRVMKIKCALEVIS